MVIPRKTMEQLEGGGGAWPTGTGEYEFSEAENSIIGKAGLWATILAIVMFVEAGVDLIANQNFVSAGIYVTIGIFYLLGGKALKGVVKTEGSDVTLMMGALNKLGTAFLIRIIVTAIAGGIIILVGAVVLAIVAAS